MRAPSGDLHLLAVHIYGLLMEGRYPYQGRWVGSGEKPGAADLKAQGVFHYADRRLQPPSGTPPFEILSKDLRGLCLRALKDGAGQPAVRPSAREWAQALATLEATLVDCSVNDEHVYPGHLSSCPWCVLAQANTATIAKLQQRPLPPAKKQRQPPPTHQPNPEHRRERESLEWAAS